MVWILPKCICLFLCLVVGMCQEETIVRTTSGLLAGQRKTVLGQDIDVYQGVPFATPPLAQLRFKKPIPADPWQGVYKATSRPNACMQEEFQFPAINDAFTKLSDEWKINTPISEDCLYLNLWVPRNTDKKLSAMVWIYGGGFMMGSSAPDMYQGEYLASVNNVIVASMQYRLGAFGFMSLGTEDAPGNAGLWDQNLALDWLHKNLDAFGGDPESITIFGESAGAASVTAHLLAPASRNLIRRGIAQSGSINAPWACSTPEKAKMSALILSKECGCDAAALEDNPTSVIKCMQDVPAEELSKKTQLIPSSPTVDGDFFPKHPMEMLKEGDFKKAPIIMGVTQSEGSLFLPIMFPDNFHFDKDSETMTRENFTKIVNTMLSVENPSDIVKQAVITWYSDWSQLNDMKTNQKKLAEMMGDTIIVCPSNQFAELYSQHGGKVNYYYFTQMTSSRPFAEWMGSIHTEDIAYVFGQPLNSEKSELFTYTQQEKEFSSRMMKHFTTFAKTGEPAPEEPVWPLYSAEDPSYLLFNAHETGFGVGPQSSSCAFWNQFMPQLKNVTGDKVNDEEPTPAKTEL